MFAMKEISQGPPLATSVSPVPTVSMRVVRKLVDVAADAGVPRDVFLRSAGLRAEQLESNDVQLPRHEVFRLTELALDLTGDPALGLHWSARLTQSTFAPISHLIAHAPSLRDGIQSLNQFAQLLARDPSYQVIEQDGVVTIRCRRRLDASPRIERFTAEMTLGGFYTIVRDFSEGAQPSAVCFAYAAPDYQAEYTRYFRGLATFEQAFTGLVFDGALLATPSPHRDKDIHEALRTMAERRISHLEQPPSYAERVRELLVQRGWPERMDMQGVARALGVSVRSLRRRLTSEGASYSAVENDAFGIVAKQRLSDGRLTIQETAFALGFSDTSTFHRAFKRATGTTPMKFREQQQRGP